ncbi:MAG: HPr(Ser) kinase/phosphatase [Eubacteriales bacterium]|nr:HPr(Ser) kinase/phosphatase [Eubacteriales bacterium]
MEAISLKKIIEEFDLKIWAGEKAIENKQIHSLEVMRPGLQIAGHYAHFVPERVQVIGNMEWAFLQKLSAKERYKALEKLMSCSIPCLILARSYKPDSDFIELAESLKVPLLGSDLATSLLISKLFEILADKLAPRTSLHAVLVEVYGEGILILGDSGVGKSETALEIVKRGHRLIADDLVEVRRLADGSLIGRAPDVIRHLIEIRGLGILDIKEIYGVSSVKPEEQIHCVIKLELWDEEKEYDRSGLEEEVHEILGVKVPAITIPVRPGRNLAVIVEVAAINFRQKKMGYNAALELAKRLSLTGRDQVVLEAKSDYQNEGQ